MKVVIYILLFFVFSTPVKAGAFSEIFGSEGAAGIANEKTRNLSWTIQYLTLSGSIAFAVKQLYDTGFLQPIGFVPESMIELSPLAYKKNFLISDQDADVLAVNQKVNRLNHLNDLKKRALASKFSYKSIESRNNSNFFKSLSKRSQRDFLIGRYLNE